MKTGAPQVAVGVGAASALGVAPADLSSAALGAEGFVLTSNRTAALRAARPPGSVAVSGAPSRGR